MVTDPNADGSVSEPGWMRVAAAVAVAWYALALFPGRFVAFGPRGIDPAWQWVVNAAASQDITFGTELVFTYGPLAFLIAPLDVARNLAVATGLALVIHSLVIASLVIWWRRAEHAGAVLSGVVVLVMAPALFLETEGLWLLTLAWLAFTAVELRLRWPGVASAALAGVFVLVKTSLGVASVAVVGLAVLGERMLLKRPVRWEMIATAVLAFTVMAGVCFGSPGVAWIWAQRALEVVSGYSVANSIVGPASGLLVGVAAVAVWIGVAWVGWSDGRVRRWVLLTAPLVLIQFRLAYVRQDGHELQLFGFLCGLVALTVLVSTRWRSVAAGVVAGVMLLAGSAVVAQRTAAEAGSAAFRAATAREGVRNLSAVLRWSDTRRELAARSAEQMRELVLPEEWHARLGPAPGPVGTLPWECQIAPANGLQWAPTPTLQLYSAYTAELDAWSARRYAADGPRWIVNEYVPVGKRHQMLDAPATWRTLFRYYEPRTTRSDPYAVLLERRALPLEEDLVEVGRSRLVMETPVEVPFSDHILLGYFDLELNLRGRVQSMLFRVPPVMLRMDHASGRTTVYRLVPGTAANGVVINRFPGRFFERYLWLWSGRPMDEVVRITLTGPGTACFVAESTLIWRELRIDSPSSSLPIGS